MHSIANPQVEAEDYVPPSHCVTLTRYFYPLAERSERVLFRQLREADRLVARTIVRPLQAHQHEALLCLVSDMVAGLAHSPTGMAFERSFLVSVLNRGMFQIAAAEFHVFCYADGKVQTRLWEKRRAEQFLFSRGLLLFE